MRLGLGNNLVKTAFPIGTSPSLDLAFALDRSFTTDPADAGKALITSRRGPAAKFSRGSGATQVNSAGLIEYAPENQMVQSGGALASNVSSFTAVATSLLDPDGDTVNQLTTLAVAGQARLETSGLSIPIYTTYFSVWVRAKEGFPLPAYFHLVLGDGNKAQFNTSNWSITNDAGGVGSVEFGPDGWVKLKLVITTFSSSNFKVVVTDAPTYGAAVAAGKVFFIGGRNVSRHSFTHYKTIGSAFYGPRFDHDPATGVCKGLLIEESRTNLSLYSGAILSGIGWNTAETISTASGAGPDGNTAYNVSETEVSFAHSFINTGSTTAANTTSTVTGSVYTASIFLKKVTGSVDWVQLTLGSGGFGPSQYANFNLSTGNYGSFTGLAAGTFPRIEQFPNGWYRCSISVVATATTATSAGAVVAFTNNTNTTTRLLTYLGSASNSVLASMCQLEAGAFPTSYIPTTSGTAARSADVCSITGADFDRVYNQSELSIYSEVSFAPALVGFPAVSFNNQTAAERVELAVFAGPTRLACFVVQNNTTQAAPNISASANQFHKAALYAKLNSFQFALNGVLATKDTVGLMPTATRLNIGKQFNEVYLNGHLKQLTIYRKALTDAKLQTLTAP